MKLVESITGKGELLKVRNLYFDSCFRRNIADLQSKDIFAFRVQLSIGCFLSLFDSLFVLSFGLLFFLHNSFNSCSSELSRKFVNTGMRVDRKAILHL